MNHQRMRTDVWRLAQSLKASPTADAIHAARKASRLALLRLRVLKPALEGHLYKRLHKLLHELVDLTGESRDAEVQWRLMVKVAGSAPSSGRSSARSPLTALGTRRRRAISQLARYLRSAAFSRYLMRLNADLPILDALQAITRTRERALLRYRQMLSNLAKLLKRPVTVHTVHPLRVQVRKAYHLARLFELRGASGAGPLGRKLHVLQADLGDLHDAVLLALWLQKHGLMDSGDTGVVLESVMMHTLRRCRRKMKPLRHAIHRYLRDES
ncbi:MAG TPA: CHAD domain-containing protein [Steroidobacteraceae bacterium]|nr:CHAD domain-containing protein [Steroidobacteraceae bacterium]